MSPGSLFSNQNVPFWKYGTGVLLSFSLGVAMHCGNMPFVTDLTFKNFFFLSILK